jgi:alpha-methylacyl-CoA racemase
MGPLTGIRIIEIEGLGPAPFAGMMFADMGAEVISISRKSAAADAPVANVISERGIYCPEFKRPARRRSLAQAM